jgi:hypothetical protein
LGMGWRGCWRWEGMGWVEYRVDEEGESVGVVGGRVGSERREISRDVMISLQAELRVVGEALKGEAYSFRTFQPDLMTSGVANLGSSLPSRTLPSVQSKPVSNSEGLVELSRSSPPSLHSPDSVTKIEDRRMRPWTERAWVLRKESAVCG